MSAEESTVDYLMIDEDIEGVENEDDFSADFDDFSNLSLSSSDWTVETLFSQIEKGNIDLSPGFQRREVWDLKKKSAFIESLILSIPVPQIVIASKSGERGKYIVLDGKQRLLSILGFYKGEYKLREPSLIKDLKNQAYTDLDDSYRDALDNATMRTVRLSGWKKDSVLYTIFDRLNSGSVALNTQELRSALLLGPFTTFASEFTSRDLEFAALFSSTAESADFRMRDIEMLTRYCGIVYRPELYAGNLKEFLDETTKWLNGLDNEQVYGRYANEAVITIGVYRDIYAHIAESLDKRLIPTFSLLQEGKKQRFNRAVFDALCYPAQDITVRASMSRSKYEVAEALIRILSDEEFISACSVSTKTKASLVKRVGLWAEALTSAIEMPVKTLVIGVDGNVQQQQTVL